MNFPSVIISFRLSYLISSADQAFFYPVCIRVTLELPLCGGGQAKSYHILNLKNEVRDTIVKVIVNKKPVANNDIKATLQMIFVPNRIEL